MSIDENSDISLLIWKNDTPYDPCKTNHDLTESIEQNKNVIDLNSKDMSEELKIALQAWDAIYNSEGYLNPKIGHKDNIKNWIEKNHPQLTDAAKERIATVVNLNKKGGATPTEQY